eukprot:7756262-Karenia_brevis.AAC.1
MDQWGKGGYGFQNPMAYGKGKGKGWTHHGKMGWKYNNNYNSNISNNNHNWRANNNNNFNDYHYNPVAPRFKPLPSGLDQWACTVCHLVHHNMEKPSCRRAGCKGINPY